MIILDTVMIANNLEWQLSIWYSQAPVKSSTDYPGLWGTYE